MIVRTKVTKRTITSVFFAVLQIFIKCLYSHILYATIKRTAAITGIGINLASGIKNSKTKSKTTACTIPEIGLLPPFFTLAEVLAIAPVAGIHPKSPEAILPMPCAIR